MIDVLGMSKGLADFWTNKPFPNAIIDGLVNEDSLILISEEFEKYQDWQGEKKFKGSVRKRWQSNLNSMPAKTAELISYLNSPGFVSSLSRAIGEELIPDNSLQGGGMHSTRSGGFLAMHADYCRQRETGYYRRINLILYLNRNWKEEYGGSLLLGDKRELVSISPEFNRMCLFRTDDLSLHGQPDPLKTPKDICRNSIAVYYYLRDKPKEGHYSDNRDNTEYTTSFWKRTISRFLLLKEKLRV